MFGMSLCVDICIVFCLWFGRRSLWLKACSYTLNPSQSEVKVDFPLPITARNVIIEFADFYENVQVWIVLIFDQRILSSSPRRTVANAFRFISYNLLCSSISPSLPPSLLFS